MNLNDKLSVTLEAQQWNQVLAQLAQGPYSIVAPLLQEIQRQCAEQDKPAGVSRLHPVETAS